MKVISTFDLNEVIETGLSSCLKQATKLEKFMK